MDVAVNLVESYLRNNGYFTLSEFEVQKRAPDGTFDTLTDVDIVGLRFPGDIYAADADTPGDERLLLIHDETLLLRPDMIDVIIGEVKQGPAVFNPGLRDHAVLHSVLRRVEWVYDVPVLEVLDELQKSGTSTVAARNGGEVRTRLVAFGRSEASDLNTISLTHILEQMMGFMADFDNVLRPAQIKDPAPAMLRLLVKTGFSIRKGG